MAKPDISQLLIDSALRPELLRRLAEAPDEVFEAYELTGGERELLMHPDHRLLPLLGAALLRRETGEPSDESRELPSPPEIQTKSESQMLPDAQMALTVVPCLIGDRIAFAAWIAPMHEGADPSRLPPPAGAGLPGRPLTPLHAVIQLSSAQSSDGAGGLQLNMWASFRQSSNTVPPAPAETAGNPEISPFGSAFDAPDVRAAAAAVHAAAPGDRYGKLVTLTRALKGGDVR